MGLRGTTVDDLDFSEVRYDHNHHFTRPMSFTVLLSVASVSEILRPYRRSLEDHTDLVKKLRSHTVSFETSRDAINSWVEQRWLAEDGWDANWEDLCAAEIHRWESR